MKKWICVILSAAMLILAFGGCAAAPAATTAPIPSPTTSQDPSAQTAKAFNADLYKADTVMFKADGKDIYWSEYLYWLAADINYIYSMSGQYPSDWNAALTDSMTVKDYVLNSTSNSIMMYRAVEKKATEMGLALTDQDKADVDSKINGYIESSGGKEAFAKSLADSYLSEDLYRYLLGVASLYEKIFIKMYGESAEKYSDASTMAFSADKGYMKVKHIYMASSDDQTKDNEVKTKMQSLLDQLKAVSGTSDRNALFDQLMKDNSQDTGLSAYPDGYLFKQGDMDTQFESASQALAENSVSELVKSGYGYHIILRLPIKPDDTVFDSSGTATYSLRYFAAYNEFQSAVDSWTKEIKTESTDSLKNIDLTKIYKE